MPDARLGLAGWSYPEWVGPFYAPGTPPGGFLEAYARVFRHVEIDSTYYAAPAKSDVARWASVTPEGFTFSPKLPARIVQEKKLEAVEEDVDSFLASLAPLRTSGKLGPVLASFPPGFRRRDHADRLDAFLAAWPKDTRLAVELRHASWWTEETYTSMRAHGAIHVWAVTEYGRTPPVRTADEIYLRVIGDRGLDAIPNVKWDRVRRDQSEEMAYWAREVGALWDEIETVWIIANNHFTGYAPEAARRLAEHLKIHPPPDLALARGRGQRGLHSW